MMPWQIFASCLQRPLAKTTSSLFKYHVRVKEIRSGKERTKKLTVVEIHVPGHINFKWNHSNLDNGCKLGKVAAEQAIKAYNEHESAGGTTGHISSTKIRKRDTEWQRVCDIS